MEYFEAYPYILKDPKGFLFFNSQTMLPIKRGQAWKFVSTICKEAGLRGLLKVNIEGVMITAGQNLKRLLNHRLEEFFCFCRDEFGFIWQRFSLTFSTGWFV